MKTETMIIDMLWRIFTNRNYTIVVAAPFENQIRLIFGRINEILNTSPLLKSEITTNTKSPYQVTIKNGSKIIGFTTGYDAASIRGQKADWLYLDEVDYMDDVCFDAVTAIAIERADIGITMSSTPTGARSHFYNACTDKNMGYVEHFHPSMHNPGWNPTMEAELRTQLTEQGYVHEVLAEFGTQDKGVFPKNKIDAATLIDNYAYNDLTFEQQNKCDYLKQYPHMLDYSINNIAPFHPFRTMGIDWDKFGATSTILVLEYDLEFKKFRVIKRVSVPRGDYSFDNAVKKVIEFNRIYNPAFIYCDAGSGEYQIETLHMYGEKHPSSGLKNKVKRWQFKQNIDIIDPITFEQTKSPMKQFMVTQLTIAFERDKIILSPFDNILYKQLIKYEVVKKGSNNLPIYSEDDEHSIDALGLAYLAFILEFKDLTDMIKDPETSTKIEFTSKNVLAGNINQVFNQIQNSYSSNVQAQYEKAKASGDLRGDRPTQFKVPLTYKTKRRSCNWGSRSGNYGGRSMW